MTKNDIQTHSEPEAIGLLEPVSILVDPGCGSVRLDKFLADSFPELSRTRFRSLIENGLVLCGEKQVTDPSVKVKSGELYTFIEPEAIDPDPEPEDIPIHIVYEDDDLLVINKDSDMVVHPAAGHRSGTLVNALLHHCGATLSGIGGVKRPGIVHRLDRGTSGLMIVAKNDRAHAGLQAQLQDHTLGRIYTAITFKVPLPPRGTIDRPIGRHPVQRLKMTIGGKDSRSAVTHYQVRAQVPETAALVECRLETGRTHQIRVHLSAFGYPLIGDPLYGPQETALRAALRRVSVSSEHTNQILNFPRQALHARAIHFIHPATGESRHFETPLPPDMTDLVSALGL